MPFDPKGGPVSSVDVGSGEYVSCPCCFPILFSQQESVGACINQNVWHLLRSLLVGGAIDCKSAGVHVLHQGCLCRSIIVRHEIALMVPDLCALKRVCCQLPQTRHIAIAS